MKFVCSIFWIIFLHIYREKKRMIHPDMKSNQEVTTYFNPLSLSFTNDANLLLELCLSQIVLVLF